MKNSLLFPADAGEGIRACGFVRRTSGKESALADLSGGRRGRNPHARITQFSILNYSPYLCGRIFGDNVSAKAENALKRESGENPEQTRCCKLH
jgi:hypothetical protein